MHRLLINNYVIGRYVYEMCSESNENEVPTFYPKFDKSESETLKMIRKAYGEPAQLYQWHKVFK